jgi:hypothetical protein
MTLTEARKSAGSTFFTPKLHQELAALAARLPYFHDRVLKAQDTVDRVKAEAADLAAAVDRLSTKVMAEYPAIANELTMILDGLKSSVARMMGELQ